MGSWSKYEVPQSGPHVGARGASRVVESWTEQTRGSLEGVFHGSWSVVRLVG